MTRQGVMAVAHVSKSAWGAWPAACPAVQRLGASSMLQVWTRLVSWQGITTVNHSHVVAISM